MVNLWQFYFANLVGWTLHPGYKREGTKQMSVEECAALATHMVFITETVEQMEKEQCPGEQ